MKQLYETVKTDILSSMVLTMNRMRGKSDVLSTYREEETENGMRLTYDKVGVGTAAVDAVFGEGAVTFFIDAVFDIGNGPAFAFQPENAVTMTLGGMTPDALLASHHDGPYWMLPSFPKTFADLLPQTQSLFIRSGNLHYHLLPLCGDNFRCELQDGKLCLTSDAAGLYRLNGAFLSVAVSTDPFETVSANYAAAKACGAIRVPLRKDRSYPEVFEYFGFCTWNAFYQEVTSEKIYKKLDEFKEKNIPVKWMIIDDGWMTTENGKLAGFPADSVKFPEGLKETVRRIKEDYGVRWVGVWHAFNGYWSGISEGSPLWKEQKENLLRTPAGIWLPSLDEEKAFRFWDTWHSYLADCGIDFLKVDNQSSNTAYLVGTGPTAENNRICHRAIERSISKNFGGAVIDCMGMDMENVFARPMSAVSRNSDDFFPKRERGFIKHLKQNVYSAIWHGQMHFCDFDMWWSDHESAAQSGVLRAISGSPVYVSDEVGHSLLENILPVVESDGAIMRCEEPAQPLLDCFYEDSTEAGKLLKVWNRVGGCFGVAAFNVSDGDITDTVDFAQVPVWKDDGDYVAYEYFTGKWSRVNRCEDITLTLPKDGIAVWSIYPVVHPDPGSDEGAYVLVGDTGKYLPIASKYRVRKMLSELL